MISRINRAARRQEGFTLVELLVVIGIIGILAMLLLPQFRGMRDRARIASCQSNLKNIGTQLESEYVDAESYPTDARWAELISTTSTPPGALSKLANCPANKNSYTYYTNPTGYKSSGVVTFQDGTGTGTINSYAVTCGYHNGSKATFPESVQLFVTQDGVERRDYGTS